MAVEIVQTLYVQALQNNFCDVTIDVHGHTYGAHRGVLVQASPYFEKMFSGDFREGQTGQVSFSALMDTVELFEEVLKYLYLHEFDLSDHDTEDVLKVATLLLLDDLVQDCQQYLLERLTVDNALYTWSLSNMFCLTQLEDVCRTLTRCHFRDTLQHGTSLGLPVGLLCYFIKQGMLDSMSITEQLRFLQRWLQESTRKCLWRNKPIHQSTYRRIITDLAEAKPDISTALSIFTDTEFLTTSLSNKDDDNNPVDAILQLACVNDSDKAEVNCKVRVGDLSHGQWYESSQFTLSDTYNPTCIGVVGKFIVLKNKRSDDLLALDNVNNTAMEILTPLYSFKTSHHIFSLAGSVCCVVSMMSWAVPSDDDHTGETFIAEDRHLHKREGNGEGRSAHHRVTSIPESKHNGSGDSKQTVPSPPVFPTCNENWFCQPSTSSLSNTLPSPENKSPVDLSFKSNAVVKHCLFRLQITCECDQSSTSQSMPASGDGCLTCPLTWSYVSAIGLDETASKLVLKDYQSVEIDGKYWIMAFGSESKTDQKNDEDDRDSWEWMIESGFREGPFWFCVTPSDSSPGNFAVDVLPFAPEKRMKTSRPIDWNLIELITIQGCPGLRSTKAAFRYCMHFDTKDWRWKWLPYRRRYYGTPENPPIGRPEPVTLPIKKKPNCKFESPCQIAVDDQQIFSCTKYPMINQLWRYDTESDEWQELPPTPLTLTSPLWLRYKLPHSILSYLHPNTAGNMALVCEEELGPFAEFEIKPKDAVK